MWPGWKTAAFGSGAPVIAFVGGNDDDPQTEEAVINLFDNIFLRAFGKEDVLKFALFITLVNIDHGSGGYSKAHRSHAEMADIGLVAGEV